MSLDAGLALIPVLLDEVRALRREFGEMRARTAEGEARWLTQTAWAKARGVSVDTAARLVERGEVEVMEVAPPVALKGPDGEQLRDRQGRPRFRRNIRLKLSAPVSRAEVRAVAAEMTGPVRAARSGRVDRCSTPETGEARSR